MTSSAASSLPQKRAAETASSQAKRIALEHPGPAGQDEAEQRWLEAQKRHLEVKKEKARGDQMRSMAIGGLDRRTWQMSRIG